MKKKNGKDVIVSYSAKFYAEGYDDQLTREAGKFAGRLQGRGYCFRDEHRDLVFRMDAGQVPGFRKKLEEKYDGVLGVKALR